VYKFVGFVVDGDDGDCVDVYDVVVDSNVTVIKSVGTSVMVVACVVFGVGVDVFLLIPSTVLC